MLVVAAALHSSARAFPSSPLTHAPWTMGLRLSCNKPDPETNNGVRGTSITTVLLSVAIGVGLVLITLVLASWKKAGKVMVIHPPPVPEGRE